MEGPRSSTRDLSEGEARRSTRRTTSDKMNLGFVDHVDFQIPWYSWTKVNQVTKTVWIMGAGYDERPVQHVPVDGIPGPKTVAPRTSDPPRALLSEDPSRAAWLCRHREAFKNDQLVFLSGWMNRTHILQGTCWGGRVW